MGEINMKVSYDGSEAVHKDVYRNLMYTGDSKYGFVGENGFDNAVGVCTQVPNFTPSGDQPTPPVPPEPPVPEDYWGLTFTAVEAGSTISMNNIDGAPEVHLQTSTDGETWTPFIVGETIIILTNVGDKVYFAATDQGNHSFGSGDDSDISFNRFVMTGKISASGDITSLLNNSQSVTDLTGRACCFYSLFSRCNSLTKAPFIPAINSPYSCTYLFSNCTSLDYIEVGFTNWEGFTTDWVKDVAVDGTFKCPSALGTNETMSRGFDNCPDGWTVVNT